MSANDSQVAVAKDHDPFDVFRVDSIAFRLVPLIYSGGRDEKTGLFDAPDYITWQPNGNINVQVKRRRTFAVLILRAGDNSHTQHRATEQHWHFVHGVFGDEYACRRSG